MLPHPGPIFGALPSAGGTWFCVEAPNAKRVELCLFEPGAPRESRRLSLLPMAHGIHRLFVQGVQAGQEYGYRVAGPALTGSGRYFNPQKLLVDPWARRVTGPLRFHPSQRTFSQSGQHDVSDSAVAGLRSVVTAPAAHAPPPPRSRVALSDTVVYECHVRGMTIGHPQVPQGLRGRFLGVCDRHIIEHLQRLSVTTVSLMPVTACYVEEHLVDKGLTNYWGYAPFAAFAPDPRFATVGGDPVVEFREMVAALHDAGLEVVVDVVFNHTAEGDARGATLSMRGLDHDAFYAVSEAPPHQPLDYTGCGNSLDLTSPTCLRYVMDALRYWSTEMGVDGFRFDLATTLARTHHGFDIHAPFFAAVAQDPVLRQLKLIAEPWDVGEHGYRLGAFPAEFSEWNDRYRDGVRRFFRGDGAASADLATRLSGSSDVFGGALRGPQASVNFVTSHDGFSMWDLVSYAHAHNEDNGENGADGHNENLSHNFGVEGETQLPEVQEARLTTVRSMLLCLAMSQGIPMLSHGDELGRSQGGNNNAYCQDNEVTHIDWSCPRMASILPFARAVFAARARHPCTRATHHMHGMPIAGRSDLSWWRPDGEEMTLQDWSATSFAMRLCGEMGDSVLVLLNSAEAPCNFLLPAPDMDYVWSLVANGSDAQPQADSAVTEFTLASRSAALFEQRRVS